MAKKRREVEQNDPLRTVVQGVLNLILGALATWLAAKITEWILGPAEEPEEEVEE
jgi:hypothetical protein